MSKPSLTYVVVIVSTTVAAGTTEDKTSDILQDAFAQEELCNWRIVGEAVVGDVFNDIQNAVTSYKNDYSPNLIILSGGTGFATTDLTPEVGCSCHGCDSCG